MRSYSDSLSRCVWMMLLIGLVLFPAVAIDPLELNSPAGITTPVSADSGEGWYLVGAPFIKKGNIRDDNGACSGNTISISDGSARGSMSCIQPSNTYSKCGGTWTGTVAWTPPPSFMQPGSKINFTASVKTTGPDCQMHGTRVWIWDGEVGSGYIVDAWDDDTTHVAASGSGTYTVRTGSPGARLYFTVVMEIANIWDNSVTYNYTYKDSGTPAPASTPSTFSPKAYDAPGPLVDSLPAPTGEEPAGFVKEFKGTVYVSAGPFDLPPSQQKWIIVKGRTALYKGWNTWTAPGSEAGVLFSSGAWLRTKEATWWEMKPLTTPLTPQSEVWGRFFNGIYNIYLERQKDSTKKFEWETDRANGSIKGTNFVVEVTDAQTLLKVIEGTVEFTSKQSGQTTTVTTGQMIAATDSGLGPKSTFDVAAEKAKWGPMPPETTTSTGAALVAESRTAAPNSTVQLPIRLDKAGNIGSMNFVLTYDPQVLKVNKVDSGSLLSGALFTPNYKTPPLVRFGLATSSGVSGSGSVAHIEFQVIGAAGSSSPLTLSEVDTTDTSGKPVAVTTQDGTVTVASGTGPGGKMKGDYNGDGKVTELDALAALKMSVKLLTEDLILDMDGNGMVTAADARLILKQALGK